MEETDGPSEFYDSETVRKFALTEEAIAEKTHVLQSNCNEMAEEKKAQLLENSVRHWDLFYKHNTDHFFKDRAWLGKELPELSQACMATEEKGAHEFPLLIDVGCGVGNSLIPILLENPRMHAVAFDCSPRAVGMLRDRWASVLHKQEQGRSSKTTQPPTAGSCIQPTPVDTDAICSADKTVFIQSSSEEDYSGDRTDGRQKSPSTTAAKPAAALAAAAVARGEAQVFHYPVGQLRTVAAFDITAGDVPIEIVTKGTGDFVLLIFVLSALHPRYHATVAKRCATLLKPGGMVLFRDYAYLDMAQLRFAEQQKPKLEQNLYARRDGTLAYYFLKEEIEKLFCSEARLEVYENRYCMREMVNRKTQQRMQRIWIQAKFRKPLT
ncbi:uncharacterized protein LOC34617327 [Cyclospora cayetanensis]|uniref:tRNA N(3)-methylcytidine methyltransferase n=1 Tax=Cyclospora cayetanensis TaxID=88456 RepID=A0A6P6RT33_9EIME|nr:uncharacterized protein LOC34617327 [Cyclospora cayetanensis]